MPPPPTPAKLAAKPDRSSPLVDLDAHAAQLEPHLSVTKPQGQGPHPVVLQLHGCGGIQPMQMRYARTAVDAGVAAVVVDSLAPRRIGRRAAQLTVCTGLRLRGAERAVDLLAMLHWLKRQDWADQDRVAAAGWSHGGWTIMEALVGDGSSEAARLVDDLKAAILVYPYAGPPARTAARGWGARRPTVRALLGGRDAVVGVAAPGRALARLAADGLDVRAVTLPEATHCFDDDMASDPRSIFRPDLEAEAHRFYAASLAEGLALSAPN